MLNKLQLVMNLDDTYMEMMNNEMEKKMSVIMPDNSVRVYHQEVKEKDDNMMYKSEDPLMCEDKYIKMSQQEHNTVMKEYQTTQPR